MIEIADVFRRFGPDYKNKFGAAMLPSHERVITDIINCRTKNLGGHLFRCDGCHKEIFSYRSCKNRHCPKCHSEQTNRWLEQRQEELLPVPYFHITITVPEELREVFRKNQKDCYAILMKAAAKAIIKLARDKKYVGGTVGVLAVLHTWTQQLIYHPHVHCLVTGGGISDDGQEWSPAVRDDFLVHYKALARLVRGKFMADMKKKRPDLQLPKSVWNQDWVVHCKPWGIGETAVLEYLARYAFRIAITNSRIIALDDHTVTFRYKHRKSNLWRNCQLPGEEFMRRFLQHVLPSGFHKVRYYGLWHHSKRKEVKQIRLLLALKQPIQPEGNTVEPEPQADKKIPVGIMEGAICQQCGKGHLIYVREIIKDFAMGP
jgi:hypothetical protein